MTDFIMALQWPLIMGGKRQPIKPDKGCGVSEGVDKAKEVERLDFEQALAQLNDLVGKLEAGELPLEESVAAFETGVKLSRRCEALLDSAEQRLQVLSDDQDS